MSNMVLRRYDGNGDGALSRKEVKAFTRDASPKSYLELSRSWAMLERAMLERAKYCS